MEGTRRQRSAQCTPGADRTRPRLRPSTSDSAPPAPDDTRARAFRSPNKIGARVRGCSGGYAWYLEGEGHALEQWVVVGVLHLAHHPMRHTRRPHHLHDDVRFWPVREQNRKGVECHQGGHGTSAPDTWARPWWPRQTPRTGNSASRSSCSHTPKSAQKAPPNRSRFVHSNHLIFAQDQAAHLHCWTERQDRG